MFFVFCGGGWLEGYMKFFSPFFVSGGGVTHGRESRRLYPQEREYLKHSFFFVGGGVGGILEVFFFCGGRWLEGYMKLLFPFFCVCGGGVTHGLEPCRLYPQELHCRPP